MGDDVLHVGGLDEFEPAPFDERQIGAGELELEIEGVEARPEEHRNLVERDPLFAKLEDPLANETRLETLVLRLDEYRRHTVGEARPQNLGVTLSGALDDRVGEIENRLGRAVILLERDHPCARKAPLELHDVAKVRTPERIDR